jgi:hypothetical protein
MVEIIGHHVEPSKYQKTFMPAITSLSFTYIALSHSSNVWVEILSFHIQT